jgi:lantibiotic modifying enzyme
MSHGSAGAGYFLSRLARRLGEESGAPYLDAARAVAAWLDSIRREGFNGVNWYRREPDQLHVQQMQWCHGAPGIGIFHAELFEASGDETYMQVAERCAAHVELEGIRHRSDCRCHGVSGNAELFLKLFRISGDGSWLGKARTFGETVWSRRLPGRYYPAWTAGDGRGGDNPSLLTGTSGIGWFWLQLASEGRLAGHVTN